MRQGSAGWPCRDLRNEAARDAVTDAVVAAKYFWTSEGFDAVPSPDVLHRYEPTLDFVVGPVDRSGRIVSTRVERDHTGVFGAMSVTGRCFYVREDRRRDGPIEVSTKLADRCDAPT